MTSLDVPDSSKVSKASDGDSISTGKSSASSLASGSAQEGEISTDASTPPPSGPSGSKRRASADIEDGRLSKRRAKAEQQALDDKWENKRYYEGFAAEKDSHEDFINAFEESRGWLKGELDSRRKKANLRLMQSQAYNVLLEDRILELETKVRKILREPTPEPERDEQTFPPNIPKINSLTWRDFMARVEVDSTKVGHWKHRPEIDLEPKSVLELLREEPRFTFSLKASNFDGPGDSNSREPRAKISEALDPIFADHPFRIRIRSKLLLKVIKEATGCKTMIGPHEHRLLLYRPFKLLVSYEPELRTFLNKLEDLHKGVEDEPQSDTFESQNPERSTRAEEKAPEKVVAGPENDSQTVEARNQLRLLCKLIDHHFKPQIGLLRELGPGSPKVKFTDLWYLFKPGYEVRTPGNSQIQLYRIIKVNGGRDTLSYSGPPELPASKKLKEAGYSEGSFIIECFYIHFEGSRFGPVNKTFQVRKFEGEKDIRSLSVYPLQCDPKGEEIRDSLKKRGSTFAELSNPKATAHRKYRGLTLDTKRQEHVESEVVIDFRLAFTQTDIERPNISLEGLVDDDMRELADPSWTAFTTVCDKFGCCGNDASYNDYEIDEKERSNFSQGNKELFGSPDDIASLTEDQLVLLPPQVYGFVLRTRKWATFDIELLELPNYGDGWENLVIDKSVKDMVLALVENHQRPHGSQATIEGVMPHMDLVQGKGKGLIMLLHGEPGVGKTSTAECVAGHTKRPLFPITCGDIGEKADEVEDNLEKNFQLAHKWGCVLLLDEADVFLSKRTSDDIQRNAIVSVFLRTLEYYSGILFLTTNRVGKIDKAFKSRIHLSLFYPKLDLESTLKIWTNNLRSVEKDLRGQGMNVDVNHVAIIKFAENHFKDLSKQKRKLRVWNGRQIRNAFQTAVAIAKYEAKKHDGKLLRLSAEQFDTVATISANFDKYLTALHSGKSDADLAKMWQLRADDYAEKDGEGEKGKEKEREKEKRKRDRSVSREKRSKKKKRRYVTSEDESTSSAESSSAGDSSDHRPSKKKGRNQARAR